MELATETTRISPLSILSHVEPVFPINLWCKFFQSLLWWVCLIDIEDWCLWCVYMHGIFWYYLIQRFCLFSHMLYHLTIIWLYYWLWCVLNWCIAIVVIECFFAYLKPPVISGSQRLFPLSCLFSFWPLSDVQDIECVAHHLYEL